MSIGIERPLIADLRHGLEALRGNWFWFVLLGSALIVLGFVALGAAMLASLAVVVAVGIVLILGGIMEDFGAIWCRGWSGFFGHLLSGILSVVVGLLFLRAPLNALAALTLLAAFFLISGGIFKIVSAVTYRYAAWGWPLLSGVIDVILGALIWAGWPASSLWVIGLFMGINLIFRGFDWIAIGAALRSLPRVVPDARP